jgi:AcrR family transcriptional regulator
MQVMKNKSPAKQPQRRARGQKRISELLHAAGEVFAEIGYERATTNAIAAKAGVSPGTLYQFFANKQEIAEALANLYTAQNEAIHVAALDVKPGTVCLAELIDRTVDPFLAFRQNAPGYDALFIGMISSPELALRVQTLHDGFKKRLASLMCPHFPGMSEETALRYAEVCAHILKGLLPLALNGNARQRKEGTEEIKAVLERYLSPILAASSPAKNPRAKGRS